MSIQTIAAIILAAGRGDRAGSPENGPKQYRRLGSQTIIAHAIQAFSKHPAIGRIVVVIHRDDHELFAGAVSNSVCNVKLVNGGATRQQ
jgi:2-C-methyl-D-erythritol 4-phosphate cytidylyltransferase/2-C-methyl-D-erythritol 2,4-cyclodiphosphate synthase